MEGLPCRGPRNSLHQNGPRCAVLYKI
jgi:hypothetical protein